MLERRGREGGQYQILKSNLIRGMDSSFLQYIKVNIDL